MDLSTATMELFAGNGREDIVDGPLRPADEPYQPGFSSFAQPSGLSSDGQSLFVADSEGSSIRRVPFEPTKMVQTVIGTNELARARLFTFGDRDGERARVLLQHPLAVAFELGRLYVADTYNSKIKIVNPLNGNTATLPIKPPASDARVLNEPSGLTAIDQNLYVADTNNHRIVCVNVKSLTTSTFVIDGLQPPKRPKTKPNFDDALQLTIDPKTITPDNGRVTFEVGLRFPSGWKLNRDAPLRYYWDVTHGDAIGVSMQPEGLIDVSPPGESFSVVVPVKSNGDVTVRIAVSYYYCQESGVGLCKAGQVRWTIPLSVGDSGMSQPITLAHEVEAVAGGE